MLRSGRETAVGAMISAPDVASCANQLEHPDDVGADQLEEDIARHGVATPVLSVVHGAVLLDHGRTCTGHSVASMPSRSPSYGAMLPFGITVVVSGDIRCDIHLAAWRGARRCHAPLCSATAMRHPDVLAFALNVASGSRDDSDQIDRADLVSRSAVIRLGLEIIEKVAELLNVDRSNFLRLDFSRLGVERTGRNDASPHQLKTG
ncbi:hypothetical protein ACVIJ6_003433 [Bradyrhizobium sp. USDA 4369]